MDDGNFCLSAAVIAGLLQKFAKHLALLACLLILGRATGRVDPGQLTILLIVVSAATLHFLGNSLGRFGNSARS